MKLLLPAVLIFTFILSCSGQRAGKGQLVTRSFTAASIQGNHGGENPLRRLTIYLPPGYEKSNKKYPVIYFLHGFLVNDSLMFFMDMPRLMDSAIASGKIRPMILVLPNSGTRYGGSFYTNSSLTGNWADYIGKDVVEYMDKNFRTIPDRKSRGLAGHSMGGHGALKIAMLFPEVFGAVYALSPAMLNWSNEVNLHNPAFRVLDSSRSESTAFKVFHSPPMQGSELDFMTLAFASVSRTFSPDEKRAPFKSDFPVKYIGDSIVVNKEILAKWDANFPNNMISSHLAALKSFSALKIDWGRNDEFKHIPATALQFSHLLEQAGIKHFAEEYVGTHISGLGGTDGRFYAEVLPFFDRYLAFGAPRP